MDELTERANKAARAREKVITSLPPHCTLTDVASVPVEEVPSSEEWRNPYAETAQLYHSSHLTPHPLRIAPFPR